VISEVSREAVGGLFYEVQNLVGKDEVIDKINKLKASAIEKPNDLRVHLACGIFISEHKQTTHASILNYKNEIC
jgi:hypothetical protein